MSLQTSIQERSKESIILEKLSAQLWPCCPRWSGQCRAISYTFSSPALCNRHMGTVNASSWSILNEDLSHVMHLQAPVTIEELALAEACYAAFLAGLHLVHGQVNIVPVWKLSSLWIHLSLCIWRGYRFHSTLHSMFQSPSLFTYVVLIACILFSISSHSIDSISYI